jgi:hypothetical protein
MLKGYLALIVEVPYEIENCDKWKDVSISEFVPITEKTNKEGTKEYVRNWVPENKEYSIEQFVNGEHFKLHLRYINV